MTNVDIDKLAKELEAPAAVSRPLPKSVETTARNIEQMFEQTARHLEATAAKLRARAEDLDGKATWLRGQAPIAGELRNVVATERTYFEEVQSLALVDVGIRPTET